MKFPNLAGFRLIKPNLIPLHLKEYLDKNKQKRVLFKTFLILLILIGLLMSPALAGYSFEPSKPPSNAGLNSTNINNKSIHAEMLKLPISFIENEGQMSNETKFMVKASSATVYFTPSEVVFGLSSKNNTSLVRMSFEDAKLGQLVGEGLLPGTANFFIGNYSSKWVTKIPTYSSVKYKNIYPGTDLVYKGIEGNLKHELVLKPGSNPAKIVMVYHGQDNLSLDKNGSILIRTATGNINLARHRFHGFGGPDSAGGHERRQGHGDHTVSRFHGKG